jgi:hypothetical protein
MRLQRVVAVMTGSCTSHSPGAYNPSSVLFAARSSKPTGRMVIMFHLSPAYIFLLSSVGLAAAKQLLVLRK